MAREIQPIERQITTPSGTIQPSQAHATMGAATAELGKLVSDVLTDQAVYYSGLAGEQDALEGKAPSTLGLPLGRASAAYNQAVINTEARQLSDKGREMIHEAYAQMSNPATFNTQTPAEFNATVTGITQGILENARPENRGAIQSQLNEYASNAKIKMIDTAVKYDNAQTEAAFNRDLSTAQDLLQEALYSKAPPEVKALQIKDAQANIGNILNDYAIINQSIKDQLPDITKKLNEQIKVDMIVGEFLAAYEKGQEVKFLDKLTKNKPEGYTTAEYFSAMQKVLAVENSLSSAENRYNQEQYAKAHYEIQIGAINSIEELTQKYGNKVPAATFYSLSESLFAKKQTEDSVYEVESRRQFGPNAVAKLPNKTLNDYYAEKEKRLLSEINANVPEGELPLQRLTLSQKAQLIVAPAGAPIPDFLIDLGYGLKSSNQMVATDAFNAYRLLFRNQGVYGETLKGLDGDADDIAQYTLSFSDVSDTDLPGIIMTAQNNVNDKSDATYVARRERLQKMYALKDGINVIQSTYKKTYDVLPNNPNNDAHYGTFQKLFDNYFMGAANGNETVALAMTTNALRDWNKSRFSEKQKIMYVPPEATPYGNLGFWLDNQCGEALNSILAQHEKLQTGIARPKWMVDVPINVNTTDQEIMDKNYYPKRTALINGIERPIYVQSTRNTRTSSYPGEVYQFYYLDDYGVMQYLPDPNDQMRSANWNLLPMYDYVPESFSNLKDETINQMAYEIYKKENPNSNIGGGDSYVPFFIDADYSDSNKLRFTKGLVDDAQLDAIKQRLRNLGRKNIVFKDGKPVGADEGEEDVTPPTMKAPPLPLIEPPKTSVINPDEIGRRKK